MVAGLVTERKCERVLTMPNRLPMGDSSSGKSGGKWRGVICRGEIGKYERGSAIIQ